MRDSSGRVDVERFMAVHFDLTVGPLEGQYDARSIDTLVEHIRMDMTVRQIAGHVILYSWLDFFTTLMTRGNETTYSMAIGHANASASVPVIESACSQCAIVRETATTLARHHVWYLMRRQHQPQSHNSRTLMCLRRAMAKGDNEEMWQLLVNDWTECEARKLDALCASDGMACLKLGIVLMHRIISFLCDMEQSRYSQMVVGCVSL